jgi:hypothetical protein
MEMSQYFISVMLMQIGSPETRFQFVEGEPTNIQIIPEVIRWGLSNGYTIQMTRGIELTEQTTTETERAQQILNEVLRIQK